jgi:transposase-like protein
MNTNAQVTTTDKAIGQPNGLVCQLEGCGKALVGKRKKYCSREHSTLARYARVSTQPNGLLCKVCGKALNGLDQKQYCSRECTHVVTGRMLAALNGTQRKRQQIRVDIMRRMARIPAMSSAHRQRYRGLLLPERDAVRREEIIARESEIRARQGRIVSQAWREKRGDFPCPHCGSYKTCRAGGTSRPGGRCLAEGCGKQWTIGKDYSHLICPRCGSENTRKAGYDRDGTHRGRCKDCKARKDRPYQWRIGKDYGTPFTPAMVDLLRTARQTTLTADEEAQVAEILGSACEEVPA